MGLNHKARLYLSVAIGNLLMIASASCELITFPVSFVNEDKSSVPSETPKPNKPLSNDAPVVYAKPVEKNRFSKENCLLHLHLHLLLQKVLFLQKINIIYTAQC